VSRVDDVRRAAAAIADPSSNVGRAVREAAVRECGLSPEMADRVFVLSCARYSDEPLRALVSSARAGERVAVTLAATVAVAPLRAIALPWLAGASRVDVRGSSKQRGLVDATVRAFGADAISVVDAPDVEADTLIAYGRDETLARFADTTSAARFEGYGHGFGVAYVSDEGHPVEGTALDVALHDQRGCLSPQIVFVRGDATAFARALHEALSAIEAILPRGALDVGEGAAVMQWQGAAAVRCAWSRRGRSHFVGAVDEPAWVPSPGMRNVLVCRVSGVDEARALLGDEQRFLTCVGVTGSGDAWRATGARVVPAGTMQDPELDGPEDPRPPVSRSRARP
jgi:Acyl-CoA reductase (LuxC)